MSDISTILLNAAGSLLALLIAAFIRQIWWVLSGLFLTLSGELVGVSGDNWTAQYEEVDSDGKKDTITEEVRLRQMGLFVFGSGTGKASGRRDFKYRVHITRNILVGRFWIPGNRKTTGSGTFQVRIEGNERKMSGWCIWHDADTDTVEASRYRWTRQ